MPEAGSRRTSTTMSSSTPRPEELGSSEQATAYDPRNAAVVSRRTARHRAIYITDPDVFAALAADRLHRRRSRSMPTARCAGVAAADITLDGLVAIPRRAQDQPRHRELHPRSPGPRDRRLRPVQDLHHRQGQGGASPCQLARQRSCRPWPSAPVRGSGEGAVLASPMTARSTVASLSTLPAEFGKTLAALHRHAARGFHRCVPGQQQPPAHFRAARDRAADRHHLFPDERHLRRRSRGSPSRSTRIQELDGADPAVVSRRRSARSRCCRKAIDTLDVAVKSFAAFVPVGLVQRAAAVGPEARARRPQPLPHHLLLRSRGLLDPVRAGAVPGAAAAGVGLSRARHQAVNQELGTIDKFIGDGVMAFWGAPALLEDHAWRACVAALRIQRGMDALNEQLAGRGAQAVARSASASIATPCWSAISARKERMSYTVMGDGVNIAARLEGINKEFGTRICISHSVFKEAGERLCVRPIDDVTVKGRRAQDPDLRAAGRVRRRSGARAEPADARLCRADAAGLRGVVQEDFAMAPARIRKLSRECSVRRCPDDPVAQVMVGSVAEERLKRDRRCLDADAGSVPRLAAVTSGAASQRIHRGADPGPARRRRTGCAAPACSRSARAAASCWPRSARWARPRCAASTSRTRRSRPGAVLLGELGQATTSEFHRGDMWRPVAGRRFDLIVANLPHFPMARGDGRRPPAELERRRTRRPASCSTRFLDGLPAHLAPGGRAVITHNAFVGLDRSRAIVERARPVAARRA